MRGLIALTYHVSHHAGVVHVGRILPSNPREAREAAIRTIELSRIIDRMEEEFDEIKAKPILIEFSTIHLRNKDVKSDEAFHNRPNPRVIFKKKKNHRWDTRTARHIGYQPA